MAITAATSLLAASGSDEPQSSTSTSLPSVPVTWMLEGAEGTATEPATSTPGPPPSTAPGDDADPAAQALGVVDTLVVAAVDEALPPYVRDRFGDDWDYDPTTGCNTRELVLAAESVVPPIVDDRCRPTGRWVSAYDGVATTDLTILQIDHFVPLSDAWQSGAATWTDDRRRAFANDLAHPETLSAVTGSTNQSKSDSSPDEWLPPDRTSWCTYATDWVDVKATWSLSVSPAEKATLLQLLAEC